MTPYALYLQACGLSHREAADFHNVRLDTVKSWSAGRNAAPPGALTELRELYATIARASDNTLSFLAEIPAGADIMIGYPVDDHEAQALGFPCVGAWRAMLGLALVRFDRVIKLVPRGSDAASAAAVDAHEAVLPQKK